MNIPELILLAVGLSMDACAAAMADGMCHKDMKLPKMLEISLCFGLMQGVLPLITYLAGAKFADILSLFDHYIALILLGFIGLQMLFEAIRGETVSAEKLTHRTILLQGIAVSMDELAVGVSLAAIPQIRILPALVLIGSATLVMSFCGILLGKRCGTKFGRGAELLGGLIVLGIGIKIFIEHMWIS